MLTTRPAVLAAGLLAILAGSLVASAAALQVESATLATFSLTVESPAPPPVPGCTRSHGYWKTHAVQWPVDNLSLGSENYLQEELLEILGAPSAGDASLILARQQIAAKLNLAAGADGLQIASTIGDADSWLVGFSGKLPYVVSPPTEEGQQAVALAHVLEQYNEGVIGPGSCDQDDAADSDDDNIDNGDSQSTDPADDQDGDLDPVETPDPESHEGCVADYWGSQERLEGWPEGLSHEALVSEVFGVEIAESPTMLGALSLEGDGTQRLIKQATAALLNALSSEIEFEKSAQEILELFRAAYLSDDPDQIAGTTLLLEELNAGDCPWVGDGESESQAGSDEGIYPTPTGAPEDPVPTETAEPTPTPEE